jgi:16S rRNA G966 N2-methylase RsmD
MYAKQNLNHYIIYVDPPYDLKVTPFLNQVIEKQILKPEGSLFVEVLNSHKNRDLIVPTLKQKSVRKFGSAALYHFINEYNTKCNIIPIPGNNTNPRK